MNEQYKTTETEVISGEDWCSHCENDVKAWNVVFEVDSEGEYVKKRRCPHCNEKCLADSSFPIATLFFLLGFASSALWLVVWASGKAITVENGFVIILIAGAIQGILSATLAENYWKKRIYEKRNSSQSNKCLKPSKE